MPADSMDPVTFAQLKDLFRPTDSKMQTVMMRDPAVAEDAKQEAEQTVELPPVRDGIETEQQDYDNEVFPTDEELHTLRRVPGKIPWNVYTIAYVEMVERLSYYGTTNLFVNYIQFAAPTPTGAARFPNSENAQPGALDQGQQASTGLTLFNSFFNYFTPLFGAFIADTYFGRFKTIVAGVIIAICGHVILVASAAPSVIANPDSALGAFAVGIIIMGCGTGGFKPNVSPLIAEQVKWHKLKVETTKSGERVIVDHAVTAARIYNWFYLFINVGALVGQISMSYVARYVGFWVAFLIPTCMHCTSLPVLFICKRFYKLRPPEGSVLAPAVRLVIRGTKGRWHLNPVKTVQHMSDGTFWQNLKPSRMDPASRPAWMTFDDAWVDEVKRGWAACEVFIWLPFFWLAYSQLTNNLVSQAATMNLHGLPNDVISNLDPFALIIFIPITDLFLYPALRKANIRFTPIKKMTLGYILAMFAMIWAAVIQYYIYQKSPCGYHASDPTCPPAPINVWAQTGSYVFIAFSEIFTSIVSLEYGFSKAPKNMRSLVAAFALFMSAVASALSEAWLPLLVDPLITWNYGSVGIIVFVVAICFYIANRRLDQAEDQLNMLDTGHMGREALEADVERRHSQIRPLHYDEKRPQQTQISSDEERKDIPG